jgi:hypothetical protein
MKKRGFLLFVSVIFALTANGCGEKKQKAERNEGQASSGYGIGCEKASLSHFKYGGNGYKTVDTPPAQSEKPPLMKKMGIDIGNGRITLDTAKSRSFFEKLGKSISGKTDKHIPHTGNHAGEENDLGIHIEKDRIEINLYQTKKFLKELVETMEIMERELNGSLSP